MNITLYNNTSEVNKVSKSLATVKTLTGTLRDESSLITPVFRVELSASELTNINYMYIKEFQRYYFITDITVVRNGLVELKGRIDVLQTYKDDIKGNTAIIERQENEYNMYLNDSEFMTYNYNQLNTKLFPNGFGSSTYYYLTVAGGYTNIV